MTNKALVFYFPYRGVGGVSALFIRLAEVLKNDYLVYLVDFSDGYMARNLPEGVTLINIEDNPQFPDESVFIFQSFLPWRFPFLSKVHPDSRILFWGLHPQNFDAQIFNVHHRSVAVSKFAQCINIAVQWRRNKLVSIVKHLQLRNAIVFMGRENVSATEHYLKYSIKSPKYLPVPIAAANVYKNPPTFPKILECGWIGRICDFKYRILEHIICRLADTSKILCPIRLTIIGDGEYRNYLEMVAAAQTNAHFTVEFKGEIPMETLPDYLNEEVDVLFAMGTSALEGARVGVPVFLADFSHEKINKKYHFKHLFDNNGYCLGEEITASHYEETSSLETSLQAVIDDYQKYSKLSYDYWAAHFSLESSKENLLRYVNATTASFGEMASLGFFKADFFGRILRSSMSLFRKDLRSKVVGFRHDC